MRYILILLAACTLNFAAAQEPTSLTHDKSDYVDDFADIFTPGQEAELNDIILSFFDTVQMSVVTVNSLSGYDVATYTVDLGNHWGVGSKSDNGLLLLIAPNDRKYSTATGYGIEGDLTDIKAGRLQRDILVPAFKSGDFYGGVRDLLKAYKNELSPAAKELRAEQERVAAAEARKMNEAFKAAVFNFLVIVVVLFLIGLLIYSYVRKQQQHKKYMEGLAANYKKSVDHLNRVYIAVCLAQDIGLEFVSNLRNEILNFDTKVSGSEQGYLTFLKKYHLKFGDDGLYKEEIKRIEKTINNYEKAGKLVTVSHKKYEEKYLHYTSLVDKLVFSDNRYAKEFARFKELIMSIMQERNKLDSAYSEKEHDNIDVRISSLQAAIQSTEKIISFLDGVVAADNSIIREVNNAEQTVRNTVETYSSYMSKSGVSDIARRKVMGACENILSMLVGFAALSMRNKKKKFDEISDYISKSEIGAAKKEHEAYLRKQEEERQARLRREREERERQERLRSSSYSSGFGSRTSTRMGGGGFGGGKFGGGGASGGW